MTPQEAAQCADRLRTAILERRCSGDLDGIDTLEDVLFAAQYVNDDDPAVRFLAHALAEVAMTSHSLRDTFDLSKLDERLKVRREAVKKTQAQTRKRP